MEETRMGLLQKTVATDQSALKRHAFLKSEKEDLLGFWKCRKRKRYN